MSQNAANGKAVTIKKLFSRETSVSIAIQANAAKIWALLTNAPGYPQWNTTVVSIDGEIKPGGKIQLKSTLDPSRTFKLAVKTFEPEKTLAWGDGMGTRVFTLTPNGANGVVFSMTEKIGGPIFPLFANFIPPFDAAFEQFAADLKKAAEKA